MERQLVGAYAYGMWPVVAINAGIFIIFVLSFLKPRQTVEWRSMGAFSAFVVALFTEMYGFPLTVYVLASVLGNRYPAANPFTHVNGNLFAVFFGGSEFVSGAFMLLGGATMFAGLVVMGNAWKQIHRARGALVTSGIYALMRHPQYSGLFLIMLGMLLQWPTIITAVMWPVLMLMYYRLAQREEKDMENRFGESYTRYKRRVRMFLPAPPQRVIESP